MQDFKIQYECKKQPIPSDWIDLRKEGNGFSCKIEDVFNFLDLCLQKNISRQTSWIIEKDNKLKKIASCLYKRGVSIREEDGNIYNRNYEYLRTKPYTAVNFLTFSDIKKILLDDNYYVIVDSNIKGLDLKFKYGMYLDIDENIKNEKYFLKYFYKIKDEFDKNPSFYNKKILLVGGGVLSDMCGLICFLFHVSFSIIPTTMLSMVDASLGGKVGINHSKFGKNQIGSFYFPDHIYVCSKFLTTLKKEDIDNGFVESFKMAFLVKDFNLINKLLEFRKNNEIIDLDTIEKLMKIKKSFIEDDPIENDKRSFLNLGHSLAHAIEAVASSNGKHISHGMAVSVGLRFCLYLSMEMNLLSKEGYEFFIKVLDESSLDVKLEKICDWFSIEKNSKKDLIKYLKKSDTLFSFIKSDKKNTEKDILDNSVRFILLNDKGYCSKSLDISFVTEKLIEFVLKKY